MKRGGFLKRTRLNPIGKKARQRMKDMAESRPIVYDRSGGRCEARVAPDCNGKAEHPHHKQMRSASGSDEPSNLVMCCHCCHFWIHLHPKEAMERGLLKSRYG